MSLNQGGFNSVLSGRLTSAVLQEKNVSSDLLDGRVGRIYMPKQQLDSIPVPAMKVGYSACSCDSMLDLVVQALQITELESENNICFNDRWPIAIRHS